LLLLRDRNWIRFLIKAQVFIDKLLMNRLIIAYYGVANFKVSYMSLSYKLCSSW
jgi:hypothetical protein